MIPDPDHPKNDWLKCAVWAGVAGVCLGFWSGVAFTLLEVHPWTQFSSCS